MEGYGYVPDLIVYDRVVITTSSFCIHTLTAYNNFISKQLRKMDYDILDRYDEGDMSLMSLVSEY